MVLETLADISAFDWAGPMEFEFATLLFGTGPDQPDDVDDYGLELDFMEVVLV